MFFGYFLNTKKVTPSADFVISPAKAGAFLFFHTGLPLSPRPLLPFGRISPAAKPGWPVVAPAGGNVLATPFSLCSNVAPRSHPGARRLTPPFRLRRNRACGHRPHLLGLPRKIRRGISLRETTLCGCPLRGHDFVTPHQCFGLPRFRFAQAWPLGQQPGACRRSAPFRCAKPRWPVVAPAGGNVLATPFSLRSNVAPRSHPGAACPVYRTENALFCSCRVFQYLTMQVKAPFY